MAVPANLTLQRPQAQHSALAVAAIPRLNTVSSAALAQAAQQAGMTLVAGQADLWQANDGSWIGLDPNGVVQRGVGNVMFRGLPPAPVATATPPQAPPSATTAPTAPAAQGTATLPPLNLANYTLTPAAVSYGAAEVLRIPRINADPASLQQAATQAGFTADPNHADCYLHPQDQSWIALVNGRIERGFNNIYFRGVPPAVTALPIAPPSTVSTSLAVKKVQVSSYAANPQAFLSQLGGFGFSRQGPNFYSAADGSWVAIVQGNAIRGWNNQQINDASFMPPPPQPSPGSTFPVYTSLPSNTWPWYQQNTALGQLPMIGNTPQARQVLQQAGFQVNNANGRELWTHPNCGSWVDFSGGGFRLGWQQWSLGQLPYNNRTSRP